MPKLYVAFQVTPTPGLRRASGGMSKLKDKMRPHKASTWKLAVYNLKADVHTICNIIENLHDDKIVPPVVPIKDYYVNDSGQVREGVPPTP